MSFWTSLSREKRMVTSEQSLKKYELLTQLAYKKSSWYSVKFQALNIR